ncbi:hypothetical protein K488DRAFT_72246 [Vararia minispora EC-137]|uniref:Uncharacterized protein n=1 Tax=Vararia minispora EC-137 TaxID=1314806 RepID=A0ACB8QFE7_9AGAM|nr:hypothetical protein K488DRAFT_72246 [Vararia minispora EC-137]
MFPVGCLVFKGDPSAPNPALFEQMRNEADSLRGQGMIYQFWGRGAEKPYPFHWYLIWESDSRSAESLRPILSSLANRLQDLGVSHGAVDTFPVLMKTSPVPALRAPTTVNVIFMASVENADVARDAMDRSCARQDELAPPGFSCWAISTNMGGQRGLYVGGWESIENGALKERSIIMLGLRTRVKKATLLEKRPRTPTFQEHVRE